MILIALTKPSLFIIFTDRFAGERQRLSKQGKINLTCKKPFTESRKEFEDILLGQYDAASNLFLPELDELCREDRWSDIIFHAQHAYEPLHHHRAISRAQRAISMEVFAHRLLIMQEGLSRIARRQLQKLFYHSQAHVQRLLTEAFLWTPYGRRFAIRYLSDKSPSSNRELWENISRSWTLNCAGAITSARAARAFSVSTQAKVFYPTPKIDAFYGIDFFVEFDGAYTNGLTLQVKTNKKKKKVRVEYLSKAPRDRSSTADIWHGTKTYNEKHRGGYIPVICKIGSHTARTCALTSNLISETVQRFIDEYMDNPISTMPIWNTKSDPN